MENNFERYLFQQLTRHTSMQPQDVVKLCYQASFGAEHLLEDLDSAKQYFDEEYSLAEESEEPLYEQISEDICRVNLRAWKKQALSADELFTMFTASATVSKDGLKRFMQYVSIAENVIKQQITYQACNFTFEEWQGFLHEYKQAGFPAVHHSEKYRLREKPAYRIVRSQYFD